MLCLSADEVNIIESDGHSARVAKTRKAAEIMTGYNDSKSVQLFHSQYQK